MRRFLSFVLPLLVVSSLMAATAEEDKVIVTAVSVSGGMANITINDAVEISEIKVLKAGGKTTLKFPEFVSQRGQAFPQVTVHSKDAYDSILQAIETGQPSAEKAKSIKFTVAEPRLLRSPSRVANVEVTFNGAVSVGVGVLKSKREGSDPFWIGYPSRRPEGGGKYINQVAITNPKLKRAVEQAVIDKYQRAAGEQGQSDGGSGGGGGEE